MCRATELALALNPVGHRSKPLFLKKKQHSHKYVSYDLIHPSVPLDLCSKMLWSMMSEAASVLKTLL